MTRETSWALWRREFPSCERVVHMNHAGVSPLPIRVADAVRAFAHEASLLDAAVYKGWSEGAEKARSAFAGLVGADPAEIAFVQNTSEALSLVASAWPWQPGDNVVGFADEYPSNVYPWWALQRWGVETRLVPRGARAGVDDLVPFVDGRTRMITVSAVDWQTGFRFDLDAIGNFCRERDVAFCVDGIQAVGAVEVDVHALGIDFLAAGGHKWLLAPEGCGGLFVSSRVVERLSPLVVGWKSVENADSYLPYHFELRADAGRLEAGSPPHLGIRALGAAIEMLLEIGPAAIERRVLRLTEQLAEGLRARQATIVSPWGERERSGILNFQLGEPAALHRVLSEAGVVCRVRHGGVRLAPHFYNDEGDISRVLDAVDAYRRGL